MPINMNLKNTWQLLRKTIDSWLADKAPAQGAALAFYSILSIGPLMLLVLAVASAFLGAEAAQGKIVAQMASMVGTEGSKAIQDIIKSSNNEHDTIWATILGIVTLLLGASGVFGQLQEALNTIWKAKPKPGRGIWGMIQDRFLSFTMVLGTSFLLLTSLVISAVLTAIGDTAVEMFEGFAVVMQLVNIVVSLGVITLLFALMFKYVPDAKIAWRDVWVGAGITALLFTIGKFAIGLYLGYSNVASGYGAAGSMIILLVWVYYSAQILLLGAEFTYVYAQHYGSRLPSAT